MSKLLTPLTLRQIEQAAKAGKALGAPSVLALLASHNQAVTAVKKSAKALGLARQLPHLGQKAATGPIASPSVRRQAKVRAGNIQIKVEDALDLCNSLLDEPTTKSAAPR